MTIGMNVDSMDAMYKTLVRKKMDKIMKDPENNEMSKYYVIMRNECRLRALSCRTVRYRKSFVPNSIHVYNQIMSTVNYNVLFYKQIPICIMGSIKHLYLYLYLYIYMIYIIHTTQYNP